MKKKVIHLVEPDESDFGVLKAVLDGLGYEVVAMANPEAALEAFPSLAPDLVLAAYPLPTATGEDFVYQVGRISPTTLVIGIVRRGMREVARDALTHGCDDFVTKPVDPQLLEEKLQRLLSRPGKETPMPDVLPPVPEQ